MPIEQVVTVSLPRSGLVSLRRSGSAAVWGVLRAAGRDLTGSTRVVVLRIEGGLSDGVPDGGVPDGDVATDGSSDEPPVTALEWLTRPNVLTVASVSGRLTGATLDAALACDVRIVADDAQLSPSASVSGIARLGELMGYSRALEFVVTGAAISGQHAVTLGLANLSVRPEMLDVAVADMVATVLRTPREVATEAKAVLRESAAVRERLAGDLVAGIALAANEA